MGFREDVPSSSRMRPAPRSGLTDLAAWFQNIPVRLDACEGNELLGPDGCVNNGLNDFDKIWWWRTPIVGWTYSMPRSARPSFRYRPWRSSEHDMRIQRRRAWIATSAACFVTA